MAEDDLPMRMILSAALKKENMDVLEAGSGREAVDLYVSHGPDIVLMDALMPEMDGFSACEQIRNTTRGSFVQILMVTGLNDVESTRKAFEKGANGFVTKPVNPLMLGQQVNYMLRAGAAFKELHTSRNRLAKTQELAIIGNWQIDLQTGVFGCSEETCRLLGLPVPSESTDLAHFFSTVVKEDQGRIKMALERAVDTRTSLSVNYRIQLADGSFKHILNKAEILSDDAGLPPMMLGIVQDVTQLKEAEDEIRFLAFSDSLTGLANRLLFMDRLNQTILESERKYKCFALLFMDLDHFKRINDTLGHDVGDLLLIQVAKTIKASIRKIDCATRMGRGVNLSDSLIARLGGDEFTILLSDIETPSDAAIVARRLLEAIPEIHTLKGHEVSIGTSIGISIFPDDGHQAEILLKKADTAMYDAKKARGRYKFYREEMNQEAMRRFTMDMDLKKALKDNQFTLVYQPQVNLEDRRIVGAEALLRWHHPQQGIVMPEQFIPLAEESDTIIDINDWVLKQACRQIRLWTEHDLRPGRIGINLSGYKLAHQYLVQTFDEVLSSEQVPPDSIEIEMTENVLMSNSEANIQVLSLLKERGINIAIDDFGTGYSSLSYIAAFPVDTIKIARPFIRNDAELEKNTAIIKAIVAMGRSLGKTIVAEGVETDDQYRRLKALGCDKVQGYFFSRPVDADTFSRLLAQSRL